MLLTDIIASTLDSGSRCLDAHTMLTKRMFRYRFPWVVWYLAYIRYALHDRHPPRPVHTLPVGTTNDTRRPTMNLVAQLRWGDNMAIIPECSITIYVYNAK